MTQGLAAAEILRNNVKEKLARGEVVSSMTVRLARSPEIARIDTLIERMKSAPLAEGFSEVLVPGEPEDRAEAERRRHGIPYATAEVAALQAEAKRAAIQPLVLSDRPIGN